MKKIICLICNKEFPVFGRREAKFCSQKCYGIFQKGKTGYWKGKNFSEEHKLNLKKNHKGMTGKHFSEKTKRKMRLSNLGKHFYSLSEEVKKRISERMKKEKHPLWIKDRTKLIKNVEKHERNNKPYYHWRYLVFERDNWKCRINNCDCDGRIIAHHILGWKHFPELRYSINNGITLCHAHHPLKRAEEKRLIPFFQGLVPVSNGIF